MKIHSAKQYSSNGCYVIIGASIGPYPTDQCNGCKYGYVGWDGCKFNVRKRSMSHYGEPYKKGDVVTIEIDLINGQIIFYKNDKSQGVAYDAIEQGIDVYYRLGVSMCEDNVKIEMIEYSERYQ